jgi:deoxyadenosine/deoxycytidine kinase
MHIAVTGNIGAGKTTLTTMLAKHYNWDAQFEDVDHNPYLEDFYADMFELEVYSYNGKSKISLYFSVPDEIPSVAIDTEIIMF